MSFYKYFSENDRVVSSRPLPENQSLSSGSEESKPWQTKTSSPYNFVDFASGSQDYQNSQHMLSITYGAYNASTLEANQKLQHNVYNQFAKTLLGHDVDNNIKKFQLLEGVTNPTTTTYLPYCYMINIDRQYAKDRIQYGSLDMRVKVKDAGFIHITDSGSIINNAADGHHYGILRVGNGSDPVSSLQPEGVTLASNIQSTGSVGYIFYEAGIIVLSPYIFAKYSTNNEIMGANFDTNTCGILDSAETDTFNENFENLITSNKPVTNLGVTEGFVHFIKDKISYINFQSVTELNSTIYFCRAYNHEFNYSSNPTYLKNGEIIVKNSDPEEPSRTYITTVGLYSDDNQLLAVAKLSEPILKTRDNELIARVRLDW